MTHTFPLKTLFLRTVIELKKLNLVRKDTLLFKQYFYPEEFSFKVGGREYKALKELEIMGFVVSSHESKLCWSLTIKGNTLAENLIEMIKWIEQQK